MRPGALGVARVWPVLLLAGLFVPMPKMAPEQRPSLDLTYTPLGKERLRYRFTGPQALDLGDQTALLAVLLQAQASLREPLTVVHDEDLASDATVAACDIEAETAQASRTVQPGQTLLFRTSWAALCRRLGGGTGGSALDKRRKQLNRLASLRVSVWHLGQDASAGGDGEPLLSVREGKRGQLAIRLGGWLTNAVLGERYARIDLAERQALPTDIARAVHAFICGVLGSRRRLPIGLETLCGRVWPGHDDAPQSTKRRRRADILTALAAMERLQGWLVMPSKTTVVEIVRSERHDAKQSNAPALAEQEISAVTSPLPLADASPTLTPEAFSALFADLGRDAAISK